jgi:hypothetical protein
LMPARVGPLGMIRKVPNSRLTSTDKRDKKPILILCNTMGSKLSDSMLQKFRFFKAKGHPKPLRLFKGLV